MEGLEDRSPEREEFRHQVEDDVMIEAKEPVDRVAAGCIQVMPGPRFVLSTPVRP